MSAEIIRPAILPAPDSIPEDLVPFTRFASELGVHLNTLHRSRMREDNPMPAWRILGLDGLEPSSRHGPSSDPGENLLEPLLPPS